MIQPVLPDFGDIASSIFLGKDLYKTQLRTYANKMQDNLEHAVNIVKKQKDIDLRDFEYEEADEVTTLTQ